MISKRKAEIVSFNGSHYDIGLAMAKYLDGNIGICDESDSISDKILEEALKLYDQYCPGLEEELRGYADGKGVVLNRLSFISMTYLRPNCSGMVLLPSMTLNGHTIVARSYEFSPHLEDFKIYNISAKGKHSYIGGSIAEFGRSEGINQEGLGVTMTSCGFPVSNISEMRKPALKGLQFWAVIRTLLENCKTVEESLSMLKDMPIAYNINLIIGDSSGNAVIYETLDGKKHYKKISHQNSSDNYLHATNHPCLDEMIEIEPFAMKNSLVRYKKTDEFLGGGQKIKVENLKNFLLKDYPEGLNCSYFDEFFGTIKSVVMDLDDLTFSICWGGNSQNGWDDYSIKIHGDDEIFKIIDSKEIELQGKVASKEFFARVSLK